MEKVRLLKQDSQQKMRAVLGGVMDTENQAVYTGAGKTHYMEEWDWFQGVALLAIHRVAKNRGNTDAQHYLESWFARHREKGLPPKNINTVCPLLALSYLCEESGNEADLALCREWLAAVMEDFPRTVEQGLQHITRDSDNAQQLWADTLYMTVLFVARMGTLLGDDRYVQESIRQFLVHIKFLQDTKNGLFYHGFSFLRGDHLAGAFWGRGNAWYTAGVVDYLDIVQLPEGVRQFLLSSLKRQVEALTPLQTADGLWHTILDEPQGTYAEASATAGFAYGILKAVRRGWLPEAFAEMGLRAARAVLGLIDEKGVLQQVSAGTCLYMDKESYRRIPVSPQPYGQAMALLLLLELEEWA